MAANVSGAWIRTTSRSSSGTLSGVSPLLSGLSVGSVRNCVRTLLRTRDGYGVSRCPESEPNIGGMAMAGRVTPVRG